MIGFETILSYVEEVKEHLLRRYVDEFRFNQENPTPRVVKMVYKMLKDSLSRLDLELRVMRKPQNSLYYFDADEKKWSVDFLLYCFKNSSNLSFDLSYFDNEDEKREVIKFVRNKVYGSLLDKIETHKLFDCADLSYWKAYEDMIKKIRRRGTFYSLRMNGKDYLLPVNHFEWVVFYHKYGTTELPVKVKESISNRDVIDAGAFIGDSALVLNELNPRRIYAFEPIRDNVNLLMKTIKLNKLNNVTVMEKCLGCKEGLSRIFFTHSGSFIHGLGSLVTPTTTIDDFVVKNSLDVALIKMDVEGHELEVLEGAKETIKKHAPVLLIALYHNGEAFFQIPKMLKSWVPKYKFRFLNLNRKHATFERLLVAYLL